MSTAPEVHATLMSAVLGSFVATCVDCIRLATLANVNAADISLFAAPAAATTNAPVVIGVIDGGLARDVLFPFAVVLATSNVCVGLTPRQTWMA